MKITFKVECCIFGDDTNACSLTQSKALGNFRHNEALVFTAPIITFHLKRIFFAYSLVLLCLVPYTPCADSVYLLSKFFHLLFPGYYALQNFPVIAQLGR